jgi:putative SOS response-associated peptidase YedK
MCNLYSMTTSREAILRLFRISENRAAAVVPKDAIVAGHVAPMVRPAANGEGELLQMSWGLVLLQAGKALRRVTNTRDDEARSSSFWRDYFERRRCLMKDAV